MERQVGPDRSSGLSRLGPGRQGAVGPGWPNAQRVPGLWAVGGGIVAEIWPTKVGGDGYKPSLASLWRSKRSCRSMLSSRLFLKSSCSSMFDWQSGWRRGPKMDLCFPLRDMLPPTKGVLSLQAATVGHFARHWPALEPSKSQQQQVGHPGDTEVLYVECSMEGLCCWVLVESGSTIMRPGMLPNMR